MAKSKFKVKIDRKQDGKMDIKFKHNGQDYANTIELGDSDIVNAKLIEATINNIVNTVSPQE